MSKKTIAQYDEHPNFHSQGLYFQALYHAPTPILIVREDGRFLLINQAVQQATGLDPERVPTVKAWTQFLQFDSDSGLEKQFNLFFQPEKTLMPLRIIVKKHDGKALIWELYNAPLGRSANGQQMVICIAADITEKINHERHLEEVKNRLEQEVARRTKDLNITIEALENEVAERERIGDALRLSRERLKQMSRRTLTVLEADRRSISKELHDSLGASLAAIKFSLEDKEYRRLQNNNQLEESLDQEIAYLMTMIKETKRISTNLRPTTLDDLGLMATIKWYLRQFQRLYGDINIQYATTITEKDIPETIQINIYRLIQEGLSNAEKHGKARTVKLQMDFADGNHAISLFIEDDGCGFDVDEALSQKDPLRGHGLIAMRERCEIFGGSFHIESHIGSGTKIRAILPI